MNTNLSIDIPKEYNDMSDEEIARLSVAIKKLLDDLNYHLTQLDENNLSKKFAERIDKIEEMAKESAKKTEALNEEIEMLNEAVEDA